MQIYRCVCACQFWVNLLTLFALFALLSAGQKSLGRITVRREQSAAAAQCAHVQAFCITSHNTHTHIHSCRRTHFLLSHLSPHLSFALIIAHHCTHSHTHTPLWIVLHVWIESHDLPSNWLCLRLFASLCCFCLCCCRCDCSCCCYYYCCDSSYRRCPPTLLLLLSLHCCCRLSLLLPSNWRHFCQHREIFSPANKIRIK